jgi:hypothetical protein
MDGAFVDGIRKEIYEGRVNGAIPWAVVQLAHGWMGGDPNPGTAFNVDADGRVQVRPGYYFYKQVSRAGQPGMAVAAVSSADEQIRLIAFSRNGTKHADAFVVINLGAGGRRLSVRLKGSAAESFRAYRTTPDEKELYAGIGDFPVENGAITCDAPAGSVTTFFGLEGSWSKEAR